MTDPEIDRTGLRRAPVTSLAPLIDKNIAQLRARSRGTHPSPAGIADVEFDYAVELLGHAALPRGCIKIRPMLLNGLHPVDWTEGQWVGWGDLPWLLQR